MNANSNLRLNRFWFGVCALVILAGSVIRIYNLGYDSLWIDEILTATFSRSDLETAVSSDPHHPPLFYMLTWLVIRTLGETEFTLRLPAAFAGILGIALIIQMGKTLQQPWIGLWAAIFLTLSQYHLKYSQEARQYTLLMAISLLTSILLVRAINRPSERTWLIYAVATTINLYTHYGAFIVLATQAVIIAVWGVWRVWHKEYITIKYLLSAIGLMAVLYLPWVPRLLESFSRNVGQDIISDTGPATPLSEWLKVSFQAFALYDEQIYRIMPFLIIVSLLLWLANQKWFEIIVIVISLALPFGAIQVFDIARGAFARYVIYTFPFLMLLVAIIPTTLLLPLYRHQKKQAFFVAFSGLAIVFTIFSWPFIQNEYAYVAEDWRGILQYLDSKSDHGDILVGLSLSFPNGFNAVSASLPYYLPMTDKNYLILNGHELYPEPLRDLPKRDVSVWAIIYNWTAPMRFSGTPLQMTPFQSHLFVVEDSDPSEDTIQEIINFYEELFPLALAPSPKCLLAQDIAVLYIIKEDYWTAYSWLKKAVDQCPTEPFYDRRKQVTESILHNFLVQIPIALRNDDLELARNMAAVVLTYNDQEESSLAVLTYENLLNRFQTGFAEVNSEESPEPVEVRKFLMPENGDEREVLFTHPTTAISFPLQLPSEPVIFHAKIGLDPQSRSWGGDGVTFIVSLSQTSGQAVEIFRQHLHNDEISYGWHDIQLPLTDYAGQSITLTLTTEAGPAGNATGDWAGWGTPRIMWAVSEEK